MVNVAFVTLRGDCPAVTCQPACSLYSCQTGGCSSKNWKLLPRPQLVMFTIFIPVEGKVKYDSAMFRLWVWLGPTLCNHFQRWHWWLDSEDKTEHKNKLAHIKVGVKRLYSMFLQNYCLDDLEHRSIQNNSAAPSPAFTYRPDDEARYCSGWLLVSPENLTFEAYMVKVLQAHWEFGLALIGCYSSWTVIPWISMNLFNQVS